MEEEKKMKGGPIDLDWDLLLPRGNDDEPPPVLVVTAAARNQSPPPPMGGDQEELSQRDELFQKSDRELEDAITRLRNSIETIGPKLPDKGEKLRASLKRLEDEKEHRKLCRVEQDDDGCEMLTQSKSPNFTSASDGLRQEAQSSLPASQSIFTRSFCKKMVENQTGSRTVNAFESELSYLGRCDRRKMRPSGQFSPRGRHKKALSSRKSPFQCPTILSVDVDKHEPSNGDQNDGQCSTPSPCHFEETLSGSFSMKRKASQVLPSNDLRPRNGRTVVLVDEEEPKLVESVELEDKLDECMKGNKIYYPSSDDPESIEICYSDMECLAPEAYLSSTIINFYIRYLQHPTSSTDRVRCDYHFFNTYFYKKLKEAVLKSNKESIFAKFRRWWKGVSIFHKAYILLPIHENLHWSLIIICIPDKEDESGPIILHLDSLGLHFSKPIFDSIKSFLKEEWKYLDQGEYPSDLPIADRIWKNLPRRIEEKKIVVPQQRNDYDCGLFVLFFMERFIDEAPQRLKRKDLAMFGKKWFKPEEASNLRHKIRRLLVEEFRNATKDKFILDHEPEPLSSVSP
ncbi:unnamed protein product [Camellia sinensis]|uniref:ubiquitin-like-specific protease 1D isoform X1 n=2 Tax=Camellia sinensis TaxID=4442 RepID=UPI001035F91C|nr:ubiquitin-like-specific protease 1D isoform X1 [Camellia sinensis]